MVFYCCLCSENFILSKQWLVQKKKKNGLNFTHAEFKTAFAGMDKLKP